MTTLLMGPGPSNAAPEVLEALSRPLYGHLDPRFLEVMDDVADMLRATFKTSNRMTFAVSGTGSAGLEAALVNTLEPGDTAIVCRNGVFGTRMTEVATRAGATVVNVDAPWGSPIEPSAVAEALEANPGAEVFTMVHAETSTGVAQPVDEIASMVRHHGALFILDTVTSLGGMEVDVDAWGVDVAYSGTQKCLSVPPGLAPITYSERALDRVRSRKTPVQSWYLDVTLLESYWRPSDGGRVYHHTAPISMVFALQAGLRLVRDEGLDVRWKRHADAATVLAEGLEARGFSYVAPEGMRLPMLHCVWLPTGPAKDEAGRRKRLLDEHGIEVGAGLGPFKNTCWRIGLMGHNATIANVERLLAAIDGVL